MLSRRKFLGMAGGVGAAGAAGAGAWATLVRDHAEQAIADRDAGADAAITSTSAAPATTAPTNSKRVLVVLQLAGGNDGLNTLVPTDGRYRDARPTLAIDPATVVPINASGYGLHPGLAPIAGLFNSGQIAALQGIGLTEQSRSHFKAMDTWWSATNGASDTGWLGRWLDETEGKSPNPLRAIGLGGGSPALVGKRALPTVVLQPAQFALRTTAGCDAKQLTEALLTTAQPLASGPHFAAAQQAFPDTVKAIELLQKVRTQASSVPAGEAGERVDAGGAPATTAPAAARAAFGANSATGLLQSAAGIVELDIGTRIILVSVNGFDTHSDQPNRHGALLEDVGNGIAAFLNRIDKAGKANEVLLITTSEFGRRVAENASAGTDHGLAGVQFIAGRGVNGGKVVGDLNLAALKDGDVPLSLDTRSLYAASLDWLGGADTNRILAGSFDRLGLLK